MSITHNLESEVQIRKSYDYGEFQFYKGNRDIQERKIHRLHKAFEAGLNLTPYCPILVDEEMRIIDGQHRFYACRKKKMPIYYVVKEGVTIHEIALLNSNSDNWRQIDFVHCYNDLGNDNYRQLLEVIKLGYSVTTAAMLLSSGPRTTKTNRKIQEGTFEATLHDEALRFHQEVMDPISVYNSAGNHRELIAALRELWRGEKIRIQTLIDKLESSGKFIDRQLTAKAYLSHIEELYNYRNRERIRIY